MTDSTNADRKSNGKRRVILLAIVLALSVLLLCITYVMQSSQHYPKMRLPRQIRDSELFEDMRSGKSFCFIGDSITYGTVTNGLPWYEPIKPYIKGEISNVSWGGWGSRTVVSYKDEIPACDIYVFAIGINDIIYPDYDLSADDPEEFVDNLQTVSDHIMGISPGAKMYFITPWVMLDPSDEFVMRRDSFVEALHQWCDREDHIFIDPYDYIVSVLEKENRWDYMYDLFHPNAERGIELYSFAVLREEHIRRDPSYRD